MTTRGLLRLLAKRTATAPKGRYRSVAWFYQPLMFLWLIASLLPLSLTGCLGVTGSAGGSNQSAAPPETVSISIAAPSGGASVYARNTVQFTATVTGSTDTAVTWSVTESNGGTVSSSGLYTAPAAAGTYHIVATAHADTSKSASAAVTVTVPAPVFTSTPATTVDQGGNYSYTAAATDPAGTAITYTLTQRPNVGSVSFSGATVGWNPAAAQARTSYDFTITATSAVGGTQTQSWKVWTSGTISITCKDNYWSANGGTVSPQVQNNDLSTASYAIKAFVPQADGSVVARTGVGNSDGTATVGNVPGGYYWLQIRPGELYWTDSSTFDFGDDYLGRVPVAPITATLQWNLSALAAWDPIYDALSIAVPNAGVNFVSAAATSPSAGASSYSGASESYAGVPFSSLPGDPDQVYVFQKRQTAAGDQNVVVTMAPVSLQVDNGDTSQVAAAMAAPTSSANLEMKVSNSAYNAMAASVNPNLTAASSFNFGGSGELFVQPLVTDRAISSGSQGLSAGVALLDFSLANVATDQDLGSFNYGVPLPAGWLRLFTYTQSGALTLPVGTGSVDIPYSIGHAGTAIPSASQPDQPVMSPVRNPQMNGASLFTVSRVTGAITLSWTASNGLEPAGYGIAIQPVQADASCSGGYCLGSGYQLYTASTSIVIPPGLLANGQQYVFTITALADGKANFKTSPWRSGYPQAWADVVSGVIAYSGPVQSVFAVSHKSIQRP